MEIVEPGSPFDHEYLYFVGCAGSFDDRNKKTSRALAKLMQRAGLDFAILGPSEMCNGDQARRSGNEYIFQMLAMQNIETFESMGVKKIVAQCPHCFNVLKNEYPQLGGNYEVIHHSQLLDQLVSSGKLSLAGASLEERVDLPRLLLPRAAQRRIPRAAPRRRLARRDRPRRDAPQRHQGHVLRCRRRAHVDGGEHRQEGERRTQPGGRRHRRLPHRGRVPFCYVMFDDGVKGQGKDEEVKVQDIAEILWEALEKEPEQAAPVTAQFDIGI